MKHLLKPRRDRRGQLVLSVVVFIAALPLLVVGSRLLTQPVDRYPANSDTATNELRTVDVGVHPVLLGPYSRYGWSHPGPALYVALAVPFRALGKTPRGLYAGALAINLTAIFAILFLARRLGGYSLLLLIALALALEIHHLGPLLMADPWNPFVTILPYGVVVLSAWASALGARWAPLGFVVTASFCVQTHVGYVPEIAALALFAIFVRVWDRYTRRRSTTRLGELLVTMFVGAVLWLGPLIQEAGTRGNISAMWEYFTQRAGATQPLRSALGVVSHPFAWSTGWIHLRTWNPAASLPMSISIPLVLVAFAIVGVITFWTGPTRPRLLACAIGTAIGGAFVAVWRTPETLGGYRLGWLPLLAALTAAATAWMTWSALKRWTGFARDPVVVGLLGSIGAMVLVIVSSLSSAHALDVNFHADPSAGGAAITPLLEAARNLPSAPREIVVKAGDPYARWYLPDSLLWLRDHGAAGRLPAERIEPTRFSLYDDAELVFGQHRICRKGRVGATLVIRVWPNANAPSPPGLRFIARRTVVLPIFYPGPRAGTLALYRAPDHGAGHVRVRCRASS